MSHMAVKGQCHTWLLRGNVTHGCSGAMSVTCVTWLKVYAHIAFFYLRGGRALQVCVCVCSLVQRVAACCSVLQRVAACCSVLQCVAVWKVIPYLCWCVGVATGVHM